MPSPSIAPPPEPAPAPAAPPACPAAPATHATHTALVGLAGALPARAQAVPPGCNGASCTVTTALDTTGGAQTSLRDAINYLNYNYATSPTTQTTITLAPNLGTLHLGANLPLMAPR